MAAAGHALLSATLLLGTDDYLHSLASLPSMNRHILSSLFSSFCLLFVLAVRLVAEDDPQTLLTRAVAAADETAAQTLLGQVEQQLKNDLSDDWNLQAKLWLAVADERIRRLKLSGRSATYDDAQNLRNALRNACISAEVASNWTLLRQATRVVRQHTANEPFLDRELLRWAATLEQSACRELGDRAGEAQVLLFLLKEPRELPGLGEPRSISRARFNQRIESIAAVRGLLAADDPIQVELDSMELYERRGDTPLPDRIPLLLAASERATRLKLEKTLEHESSILLGELGKAVDAGEADSWAEPQRKSAIQLWDRHMATCEAKPVPSDASERASRYCFDIILNRKTSLLLLGKLDRDALISEVRLEASTFPSPQTSRSAAEAWLTLSFIAYQIAPDRNDWVDWAREAYAASPGIAVFHSKENVLLPDSETALDWVGRSWTCHERHQRICLQEAAKAWEELGRRTTNWWCFAEAESCLRKAGEPEKGLLPTIDRASAVSQGPHADTVDDLCRKLAQTPDGSDPSPLLKDLLNVLRLTPVDPRQHSPHLPRGSFAGIDLYQPKILYHGQMGGMTLSQRHCHFGQRAVADLRDSYLRHGQAELIDLIGWYGGVHAAATLDELWPKMRQRPDQLCYWLPALKHGRPEKINSWIDEVIAKLDDTALKNLGWIAGRCLDQSGMERVAREIIDRGTGDHVLSAFAWWASDHRRLDAGKLLGLWQRFHHWGEFRAALVPCLIASGDPRVSWWLLAVADDGTEHDELLRAQALHGLGVLKVAEGTKLCERILSATTDEDWLQAAALLTAAALGDGARYRELANRWITDGPDDAEDVRVRAAHCLLLALDGGPAHRAWIEANADPFALRLIGSLSQTRLPGANETAFALAREALARWEKEDRSTRDDRTDTLARMASLLPLNASQREQWKALLKCDVPAPGPRAFDTPSWKFSHHPPAPGLASSASE